jgi:hypothetical protein
MVAIGYSGDHGDDGGLNEEGRGEGRGVWIDHRKDSLLPG